MAKYKCPSCGSDEYTFNGVDGYICSDCSSQFFVVSGIPKDGLRDNEIFDPKVGKEETRCPHCGSDFFEDNDGAYITCFCGYVFEKK